jgi:hypothetical protein
MCPMTYWRVWLVMATFIPDFVNEEVRQWMIPVREAVKNDFGQRRALCKTLLSIRIDLAPRACAPFVSGPRGIVI